MAAMMAGYMGKQCVSARGNKRGYDRHGKAGRDRGLVDHGVKGGESEAVPRKTREGPNPWNKTKQREALGTSRSQPIHN